MKKLFILLLLIPFFLPAAFTTTGTGGVVTQIGATHAWYLANANYNAVGFSGNKVYYDIVYTVGDETSVSFNVSYCYTTAVPVAGTLSYFPESDSSGQFSVLSRTLLKATGNQRYTVSFEVPDRARWVIITFANTGGTPTGTVVIDGYMNKYN